MQSIGERLIQQLKDHVLKTMAGIPECQSAGTGCKNKEIQDLAGLDLDLPAQDGWLTWSILMALVKEGKLETVNTKKPMRWRIKKY